MANLSLSPMSKSLKFQHQMPLDTSKADAFYQIGFRDAGVILAIDRRAFERGNIDFVAPSTVDAISEVTGPIDIPLTNALRRVMDAETCGHANHQEMLLDCFVELDRASFAMVQGIKKEANNNHERRCYLYWDGSTFCSDDGIGNTPFTYHFLLASNELGHDYVIIEYQATIAPSYPIVLELPDYGQFIMNCTSKYDVKAIAETGEEWFVSNLHHSTEKIPPNLQSEMANLTLCEDGTLVHSQFGTLRLELYSD